MTGEELRRATYLVRDVVHALEIAVHDMPTTGERASMLEGLVGAAHALFFGVLKTLEKSK